MKSETTVYEARKIITMDRNCPEATHVAVRDGRILAVGDEHCADPWGSSILDRRFADRIVMPGFVEGHAHMMAGGMWQYTYCGAQDRVDPDGRLWAGMNTIEEVMAGLEKALEGLKDDQPLIAWGFDPIFLTTERLNCLHLDAISAERPIAVLHSNLHLMTANSAALKLAGYSRETNLEGMGRFSSGEPNGELQEMAAMMPVLRRLGVDFSDLMKVETCLGSFAASARQVGVTTSTDLFNYLNDEDVAALLKATAAKDFPLRLVPALNGMSMALPELVARARELAAKSTDKLRLGAVKLFTDGSIQGYTARLQWPGYLDERPNGIWNMPPEQMIQTIAHLHGEGIQMHIHVNGDEASQLALDGFSKAMAKHPRGDLRHVLQHCQLAGESQFRQMAKLGVCVNLFANHIWYFGDQHYELTVGPDKAMRMNACASALRNGVPLAIHSDAPVTPMGPLHVAWCAVNRVTPSGRVLGENQKITVEEALYAITMGAAYTLHMDREVGSIETGKRADFAILERDPLTADPLELKDIEVAGTFVEGRHFAN